MYDVLTFGTRDADNNVTERMRLTSDGNLAIFVKSWTFAYYIKSF